MRSRVPGVLRRILTAVAIIAGGWLVVFHALLLYRRVADASIAQPLVLARWIGSAVLLALVIAFRRRAERFLRPGHARMALWLVVALLHVAIPADQFLNNDVAAILQAGLIGAAATALLLVVLVTGSGWPLESFSRSSFPECAVPLNLRLTLVAPRPPPSR